jgi:hypothetical protein
MSERPPSEATARARRNRRLALILVAVVVLFYAGVQIRWGFGR